jgi:hypothetical protein
MLSRRKFLALSTSFFALFAVQRSEALIRGATVASGAVSANFNIVVNFGGGFYTLFNGAYLNLAKWLQPVCADTGWLGTLSGTNGYPNGTFTANAGSLMLWDPAYYGRYTLSWSGQGGLGGISGNPVIVYSGGNGTGVTVSGVSPSASGAVSGNMAVQTASSSNSANVEFAFGVLVRAVGTSGAGDHGGAGLLKFTTTGSGYAGNFSDGLSVKPNLATYNGGAFPAGPNSDGSWSIYKIDNNTFSFQGSSGLRAGLVGLNTSGTVGANTEVLYAGNSTVQLFGTFAGFSNLVLCESGDLTDIQAGRRVKSQIVSALAATKAAYIRFMDMVGVQNIQGISSFSDRTTDSSFIWGPTTCPANYWAGQLTNAGDAFTCSNPPGSPASGPYVDGEVVVSQVGASGQNTGYNPTLGLTGRTGTAPIYTSTCGLKNLLMGGTIPAVGTIITGSFTGGGLASTHTLNYIVTSADYADSTFQTLNVNIRNAINADTTLSAKGITAQNPSVPGLNSQAAMSFTYNRNINSSGAAQLNAGMTISFSDNGSGTTYTVGLVAPGYLANINNVAFTYNALLGGWIATPYGTNGGSSQIGGVRGGAPLEFYEELCKRANAGMWYNFGVTSPAQLIYDTVYHIAQSNVKSLAVEFANETWNFFAGVWGPCQSLAFSLGLTQGYASLTGLRVIQMAQQATTAWAAAGRSRSDLKIVNAYWFIDMSPTGAYINTYINNFNGGELIPGSNVTLAAYGGLGATAFSTNSSVAPNRPADWSDWVSPAPYWGGGQYNSGNGSSTINTDVPLSAYNGSLLAAYNYAYGTPAEQHAALDFLYSITTGSGDLYNGSLNGVSLPSPDTQIAAWAVGSGDSRHAAYCGIGTIVASYDSSRSTTGTGGGAQAKLGVACYEGGWIMGPISNTGDPATVASNLTSLGYTNGYSSSLPGAASGGPTGASDTATVAGTNLANLLLAWKNDTRCLSLVSKSFAEFKAAVNIVSTRDALPAWYGFQGPGDWALYPNLASQSGPFQPVAALAAYN